MKTKIIHALILSCRRAAELIEKRHHFGLNLLERIQLKWHKNLCEACATYDDQNKFIHEALEKHVNEPENHKMLHLSKEEKEEIKEKLPH